jgi:N-methylhydantoinase A/oxoprolinase/acetone carboxylase beta subunit
VELARPYRLAFDVGGTFTDVVLVDDDGTLTVEKVLTTPDAPERGAKLGSSAALDRVEADIADVGLGVHGTTLVANAIIERRGARTGMVTTRGFEDVIEIAHGERYDMYDLFLPFPTPLVERRLRLGVPGRITADGTELVPLDEEAVLAALRALHAEEAEAVAVCFLHAHANPAHEQRVAELAREHVPHLAVSLSSDVAGQLGEYERFSTAVANAYVQPRLDRYLAEIDDWLTGGRLLLMGSNGGTLSVEAARRQPIAMIESGPAAGALAAAAYARRLERPHVISFDMGGTTAKVCLIDDAEPLMSPDFEAARAERFKPGSGIPLRIPVVNLIEIGAGGGSIARMNELGLLKVGPQSAGADPGPACYARGGTEPTVTDANVLLGYLGAGSFLGGSMALDVDAAATAVDALAGRLGLDATRTAWGIYDVVNENMAAAMRSHVAERNRDPRNYTLFAFGGAGPVHAVAVARKVGIPEVIVPLGAGVTSALGLLTAPMAVDLVQSMPVPLADADWSAVARLLTELERRGRTAISIEDGVKVDEAVDMRYVGQAHEITVRLPVARDDPTLESALRAAFDETYRELYSVLNDSFEVEILNWRVRVAGPATDVWLSAADDQGRPSGTSTRPVWDAALQSFVDAPIHRQAALEPGVPLAGPMIVEQRETTTVVGAADSAHVDDSGNLVIKVGR